MKGKLTVIALASIIIYWLLFSLFYFAPLFAFSFGGKPEWYIVVIAFLRSTPFNVDNVGEVDTALLFINTLFWTLWLAALLYFVARIVGKPFKKKID